MGWAKDIQILSDGLLIGCYCKAENRFHKIQNRPSESYPADSSL
ncbi:hypothetical protein TW89_0515 [Neisseria flavescens]|nr:hypothetical protein TW89_0515 [Neisseria flavescens]